MRCRRLRGAALGAALLLLAACAAPPKRAPAPAPEPASTPAEPPPAAVEPPPAPPASVWDRLRGRFAMQRCDYSVGVRHFVGEYTRSPRGFAASWKAALPFLELVADALEQRDLPGEFAMLPYVESGYRPLPGRGNQSAGMWQIVPITARGSGLVMRPDYDARLDALAATDAALDLLERYHREFGDWRLASMAFNSGEYRVKKLLGGRSGADLDAAALASLRLSRITHQHLDRLLALACIVEDPARYGVKLPEQDAGARLGVTRLPAAMDLRLAARLAGVPLDDLRRWNAGYRRDRMPDGVPHRLLLPRSHVDHFLAAAATIPQAAWNDWREERATRTASIDRWVDGSGLSREALAAANGVAPGTTIVSSTRLLLPGREAESADDTQWPDRGDARVHVIAPGDTLWSISRRYSIPLRRLRELNPQAHGTLQRGQKLRLDAGAG